MKIYYTIIIFWVLLVLPVKNAEAQNDSLVYPGIHVIVPSKEKKKNSYIFLNGGYQLASWYTVPMIPEFHADMITDGNMKVKTPGWSVGIGIMKKTKHNFEVGILGDYYKTRISLAYAGQMSTSTWVLAQTLNTSSFTEVFTNDINRESEVFVFRATIRYKIPVGNFQFWGGIAPGTFSSNVAFVEMGSNDLPKEYRETLVGVTGQAGLNYLIKDKKGKDKLSFSVFSDFGGPKIEEKMVSVFHHAAWKFINTDGNNAINPVRIVFAVGLH